MHAKSELNGKWYKVGTNWQIYLNINSTKEGQVLEQYIKVADNQNLIYSRKIHKSWFGKHILILNMMENSTNQY